MLLLSAEFIDSGSILAPGFFVDGLEIFKYRVF